MFSFLIAAFTFGVLILVHELGHFLVARSVGVRVKRFSIGFGPKLLGFKRGETAYQIAAIPFGGFVSLSGMGPGDRPEPGDARAFANRGVLARASIMAAGPVSNYLLATALLSLLFYTGITRVDPRALVGELVEGGAAEAAGLRAGDLIVAIGGEEVGSWEEMAWLIRQNAGRELQLAILREGQEEMIAVTPDLDERQQGGVIGIRRGRETKSFGPVESLHRGVITCALWTLGVLRTLSEIVRGEAEGELMGPAGIVEATSTAARGGPSNFLQFVALLNIFLGLFNLLPIPALDGGRLFFLGLELIRRRPIDVRIEGLVHAIGFILLMGLILAVTIGDLERLFN